MKSAEERSIMAAALEAREVEAVLDRTDTVAKWRFEQWLKLKFTVPQAEKLAMTRADDGTWLYPDDVKVKYLDRGCPTDIAFDLVT